MSSIKMAVVAKKLGLDPETITPAYLSDIVKYNPLTGVFHWGKYFQSRIGRKAGSRSCGGYAVISICGEVFYAHRLAWFLTHGFWPAKHIDHRDGDRLNNRIANLREATDSQNAINIKNRRVTNRSGETGVVWRPVDKIWFANIRVDGRQINLGRFRDFGDAVAARRKAEVEYFGEFSPHALTLPLKAAA